MEPIVIGIVLMSAIAVVSVIGYLPVIFPKLKKFIDKFMEDD